MPPVRWAQVGGPAAPVPGGRVPAAQRGRRDVAGTSAGARDFPSASNTMHAARRSGAERRTENAERNSGPFPFVRVRWEQKGTASDPHAAESQPRLTPTTRPDPTTKPRASRCPPATWHPRGAWGPWPDGPARRQTLPGLAPCLPSPSPPHRALCPRRRFTSTECLLFFFINWALAPALPSLLRLCPGSQRRSLSLSLKTAVAVISSWNNLVTERRARLRAELRGDASLVLIS